jgi:hypothetical protein
MNRAAWSDDPAATKEVSSLSEVPETAPTSFVIVELATPPRQAFRFAEQGPNVARLRSRDGAVGAFLEEGARAALEDGRCLRGCPVGVGWW